MLRLSAAEILGGRLSREKAQRAQEKEALPLRPFCVVCTAIVEVVPKLPRILTADYTDDTDSSYPCQPQQTALAVEVEPESKAGKQRAGKLAWPKTLSERVKAVSTALATVKEPVTATEMAKRFARARAADVGEILETLSAMGKSRRGPPSTEATAGQAKADRTFLP
jgi:hypothetical protein